MLPNHRRDCPYSMVKGACCRSRTARSRRRSDEQTRECDHGGGPADWVGLLALIAQYAHRIDDLGHVPLAKDAPQPPPRLPLLDHEGSMLPKPNRKKPAVRKSKAVDDLIGKDGFRPKS